MFPLLVDELCEVASVKLINYYGSFYELTCRRVKVNDLTCYSDYVMSSNQVAGIASALVIMGFILAAIAVIIMAASGVALNGKHRAAGILLIGPIPIMFGTDRESVKILAVLAVVLILIVLVFMLLTSFVGR